MPGNGHREALHFHHPPSRVVSLVPSITESLFDLGLEEAVVGITDYCSHPPDRVAKLPRVGGPKNPDVDRIIALQPDLVLANWEENTRQTVETLEAANIRVWVSFPRNIREALDVLWLIAGIFQSRMAAVRIETLEIAVDWAQSAGSERTPVRYFCPIWYAKTGEGLPWYMTFNRNTYPHAVLDLMGGENVFADRDRRYPLDADLGLKPAEDVKGQDTRYPRMLVDEILTVDPEVILLPDEPYVFDEEAYEQVLEQFSSATAVRQQKVHRIDGSLITWHGTRLAKALQELPALFA